MGGDNAIVMRLILLYADFPPPSHLAMLEVDGEGTSATWGNHVTDEEYM